jgi:iron complex transport system permease protein
MNEIVRSAGFRAEAPAWLASTLIVAITLATVLGSLCIGAYPIGFWRTGWVLFHLALPWPLPHDPSWTPRDLAVIQIIRLPRVLLATFAGLALGMSGTALQGMLRNPLVGPDLVGVSSGAAVGCVAGVMFDLGPVAVTGTAFTGGIVAMTCTLALARLAGAGTDGVPLILAGIFISAFAMSGVALGIFLANDRQLAEITYWVYGNFSRASPQSVWLLAVPALAGGSLLMLLRWRLNILSLGDMDARALGLNVRALRWGIIAIVSWIVAAQVSVSGVIAWVGLVIPHVARMLVGPDHRRLLPASALIGAIFVLGVDDFTRVALRADMPIGALTTLLGTPLIGFLLWRRQAKGWSND